jgi:hypothetical protein
MKKFIQGMRNESKWTKTENFADASSTTFDDVLDLFSTVGALRTRNEREIENKIIKAMHQSPLLTLKTLFHARDVRAGLGERRTFHIAIKFIANTHPELICKNIELIPHYGRWDDLYFLYGTPCQGCFFEFMKKQFNHDLEELEKGNNVSLLGKWLKSVNASDSDSRLLARETADYFGLTLSEYRKKVSKLRAKINVVERKMVSNDWKEIEYSRVPSKAMLIYRNAFIRHDERGFEDYIKDVKANKTKINTTGLTPQDIIHRASGGHLYDYRNIDDTVEALWKNLENFVEGKQNVLTVSDTSGSMYGAPMESSVGLGIYFAERNYGPFKNKLITFSNKPSWVELKGESLRDKISCIPKIISNTNIQAVFEMILDVAKKEKLKQNDMPSAIVIISDMEFDVAQGVRNGKKLYIDIVDDMYKSAGYERPNLIFWNVDSRQDTYHVDKNDTGAILVSGQSPTTFGKIIGTLNGKTPVDFMLGVLNDKRYEDVII